MHGPARKHQRGCTHRGTCCDCIVFEACSPLKIALPAARDMAPQRTSAPPLHGRHLDGIQRCTALHDFGPGRVTSRLKSIKSVPTALLDFCPGRVTSRMKSITSVPPPRCTLVAHTCVWPRATLSGPTPGLASWIAGLVARIMHLP